MTKINPILCSPSPRDIKSVYQALKETGYPRLYAKYYPEKTAYNLMRQWVLDHEEYTHMVICPDDLIIEKEHIENLIKTLEENPYPTLSGVCNVDMGDNKDKLNITENLPHPQRTVPERNQVGWRFYSWISRNTRFENPIIRVPFVGFAAMFISRDVLKRYRFVDDAKHNGTPDLMTGAIDVMFANVCALENVPQMVDTRVRMKHLKGSTRFFNIILGDGELRFYHAGTDMYELEQSEAKGKRREWSMSGGEVVQGIVQE